MCFGLYCFRNCHKKIRKTYIKTRNFLFWGAVLRFFFEAYLEMALCVCIGLKSIKWDEDNFAIFYNNVFTFAIAGGIVILPLFTSIFYGCKISKLDDEEFKTKFGTLYEGLNLDIKEKKRVSGLFFPFFFVLRRILFVFAAIFMEHFIWGQLAIQYFCSVTMIIYLLTYYPFE